MAIAVTLAIGFQSPVPLVVYVMYALVRLVALRRQEVLRALRLYRELRPWHAGAALLTLGVVLGSAYALFALPEPWAEVAFWSWLSLAGQGGANIVLLPLTEVWLAVVYLPLLVAALPFLALIEERLFRMGLRGWRDAAWRSFAFGLIHFVVGVPLVVAVVSLTLAGLVFSAVYLTAARRERRFIEGSGLDPALPPWPAAIATRATRASTLVHLAYNLGIVVLILSVLTLPADWFA